MKNHKRRITRQKVPQEPITAAFGAVLTPFLGGLEGSGTSWKLMLYTGVFNDTPIAIFWAAGMTQHSPQLQFCCDLFFISENRFWKRKNLSESKEEHCERQEDHCSVHHSTIPPPCPGEHPSTSSTWQQQKAPFKGFPHFTKPWMSCARPVGGCFVGPVAPNTLTHISPELLGQVWRHTKPCLRNSTSNHIPVHKSHFSLWVVAAFSSATSLHRWFCWYWHPHLHQLL